MTEETEDTRLSSKDLALEFYRANELAFVRAAGQANAADRRFDFSAAAFDDWAVKVGQMPMAVRDAASTVEARGLSLVRSELRNRLNVAARRGIGQPRAYSIEARYGRWRVVLFERFLEEQPHEIVEALCKNYERAQGRVDTLKGQCMGAEHLSDSERMLIMARLEGAESAIFFGIQQVEMAVHQIHPDAKMPDLRKLRREMSVLLRSAFYGKAKPAKKLKKMGKRAVAGGRKQSSLL